MMLGERLALLCLQAAVVAAAGGSGGVAPEELMHVLHPQVRVSGPFR